jgi:hypothetical protein
MALLRWRTLLAGLWAGVLLCVAGIATPAPFALLAAADAGRVAGRILAQEATLSLALGLMLALMERRLARNGAAQFSTGLVLALGTIFCTVAGYFAIQPLMPAARLGQGALTFGQLHAISAAFYGVKVLLVLALAWRATRDGFTATAPSS